MSGRICEQLVERYLPKAGVALRDAPRLGLAVFEDHHVLGKRIVHSMLRSAGHAVLDYGHGIGTEALVRKAEEDRLDLLLLSVLMLRSALRLRELVLALGKRGLPTRVAVGGAPFRFDAGLADEIGAHAFGTRASDALDIVARFSAGGAR
ncbi:MAG: cobalamin B12-binding domain-containing protein [Deferrisomatales bacterium]